MAASLYDSNLWVALTFPAHPHHGRAVEIVTLDADFKRFVKDGL